MVYKLLGISLTEKVSEMFPVKLQSAVPDLAEMYLVKNFITANAKLGSG